MNIILPKDVARTINIIVIVIKKLFFSFRIYFIQLLRDLFLKFAFL